MPTGSSLLRHKHISTKKKLQVYVQIVQFILTYSAESQIFTESQLRQYNTVHFRTLRQTLGIKSSHYNQVLSPSEEQCSHEFFSPQAHTHLSSLLTLAQSTLCFRIKYLGQILKDPSLLEHQAVFGPAHTFNRLSSPFRQGLPRAHWHELPIQHTLYVLFSVRTPVVGT